MRVLLTGAFGNIGSKTLKALLAAGHDVRCFDLPSKKNLRTAKRWANRVQIHWGDLARISDLNRAVVDQHVVIHNAAIIPPFSERDPVLTKRVNVEGTRNLIAACEAASSSPKVIFSSSVSLFGASYHHPPPRTTADPIQPSDHYSHSKAHCEKLLRASSLEWVILRFAAAPETKPTPEAALDLEEFFDMLPNTRVEFLHPGDAALAQCNAVTSEEVWGKILLVGGGSQCQVRMKDLNKLYLEAFGIGNFPEEAFGETPYYTDWMDTRESQELLRYQTRSFDDYRQEFRKASRLRRVMIRPARPIVRWLMLRKSPHWSATNP